MASEELTNLLVKHLHDAHAMEQNVLRMLDGMIVTTEDDEMRQLLEAHRTETERHEQDVRARLEAHGAGPAISKEAPAIFGALMKGALDVVRNEKPGRNARDGFVTEHLEIASYELLERLATRAGDAETAEVARRNKADEEQMAEKISQNWDKVLELTLEQVSTS